MNILILDSDFNQISLLSNYESLNFKRCFLGLGEFEIIVNVNNINTQELKVGRIIYLDSSRVGIIERVEISRVKNKSEELLFASGIELKDVISRRITIPLQEFVYDEYVGKYSSEIASSLIDKHLINPIDPNRKMDNFCLNSINNLGTVMDYYSTMYDRLNREIYVNLLKKDKLGLVLSVDIKNKKATFEIKEGMDRTIEQSSNPTAIFSLALKTSIGNYILQDETYYTSVVMVNGYFDDVGNKIVNVHDDDNPAGLERREAYFEDISNSEDELNNNALSCLENNKKIHRVMCTAPINNSLEYNLGDIVSVMDHKTNIFTNLQISEIEYKYSANAPDSKTLTFGNAPFSIGQAINTRMSSVNNI